MAQIRRGEVRLVHVMILAIIVIVIGVPILIFLGLMGGIAWLGLTKENMERGITVAKGYTAAKTPGEAMEKFRSAIQNRDYDSASYYTTKSYSDLLKKSHSNAKALGNTLDKLREWASPKNKGLMTDKLRITFFRLDPFPKNFKLGPAPKQDGDKKSQWTYAWEPPFTLDNPNAAPLFENDLKQLDLRMFNNVLFLPNSQQAFLGGITVIPLVKEGEEWKLDIPMTPAWELEINYFNEHCKSYQTALDGLWNDANRERYDTKAAFEGGVMEKLRGAK